MLSYYGDSMVKALLQVYPNISLEIYKFKALPSIDFYFIVI